MAVTGGVINAYETEALATGDVSTLFIYMFTLVKDAHPIEKLLGLDIENCGTPTEAVTCTDSDTAQPLSRFTDSTQYGPV